MSTTASSAKASFTLFCKGLAMGLADLVPGISGGTVALVSGIYDPFIESLARCNPAALRVLAADGVMAFWRHIQGAFLLTLFAGILTSLLTLSRLMAWLLHAWPVPVWSFFSGLVLASVVVIARPLRLGQEWQSAIFFAMGSLAALLLVTMTPAVVHEASPFSFFLVGSLAVCAMMLPGISGSFVLVLLGYYAPVMQAVAALEPGVLMPLALGCLAGILAFSRVLVVLLRRARQLTLSFLGGAVLGALARLWPWQAMVPSDADTGAAMVWLWPDQYTTITGHPAMPAAAILSAVGGFVLLWGLESLARRGRR